MIDDIKKQITSIRILIALLIIAVGIYLIQIALQLLGNFSEVIIILISSWLLSFILEPFVETLQQYLRISKILAASLVYILFFGIIIATIFLFIPVMSIQMQNLIKTLPIYYVSAPPYLQHFLTTVTSYLDNSLGLISSLAQFFLDLFLVFVISFYFITDREKINQEFYNLTPKKWHPHMIFVQRLINTSFASFIRVQLIFAVLIAITTWITLRIFNVDFAASIAVLSGILMLVPFIGPILALIPPVVIPLFTNTTQAIFILLVLIAMQQIILSVIGPKIFSRAFKLHPVVVLLSFLIGYKVAGALGAVFAVPVFGILAVILHQFIQHFFANHNTQK